jgi:hypothetical protein
MIGVILNTCAQGMAAHHAVGWLVAVVAVVMIGVILNTRAQAQVFKMRVSCGSAVQADANVQAGE